MKLSTYRMKALKGGDVFEGIKTKDTELRKTIESERHAKFMDMLGNQPAVSAGLPRSIDPVEWLNAFIKTNGYDRTRIVLERTLKELNDVRGSMDAQMRPFGTSKLMRKNLGFYRNAYAYFKKHYSAKA